MKDSNNKKSRCSSRMLLKIFNYSIIQLFSYSVILLFNYSCSRIYDNIEEYADSEIIYAESLDEIVRIRIGYERAEIDLMKAGRIPASQIRTNKASRTVIECEDFTEPDHRRVIDSVCSWVNVTGLTQLKNYHLTIYLEDKYGNRSLPLTATVRPYTVENLNALELTLPSVIESTEAALVEWKEPISALTHTVLRYSYSYTDRNGSLRTGEGVKDEPVVIVENIEKKKDILVEIICRIVPTLSNFDGTYTPIIDTIDWKTTVKVSISDLATPVIFPKTPAGFVIDRENADLFPFTFLWLPVKEVVSGYTLKISTNPNFPATETFSVNTGNVGSYSMSKTEIESLTSLLSMTQQAKSPLYWTVTPAASDVHASNIVRNFTYLLNATPVDSWQLDFRDATATLMEATRIEDYVHLRVLNNSDTHISTTFLGRKLSGGAQYAFAFEYRSNMSSAFAEWYYVVNASGTTQNGKTTTRIVQIPRATDWRYFEYDITAGVNSWGFGVNNTGGAAPENHFLRFSPVSSTFPGDYVMDVRNIKILAIRFE